jgi:hypothetical protein
LTPFGVSRKQFAMFGHNLPEPETYKEKTDLLIRGAVRVHVTQDAVENEIGPDDKNNGRHEQKCARYESCEVHTFQSIWPSPDKRGNRTSALEEHSWTQRF